MKSKPRDVLRDLLRERGSEIETNPQRVRALLSDLCPECRKEINLIIQAQQIEIPRRLRAQTAHLPVAVVLPVLSRLMEDHYGTSPEPARWAVETWAVAMGFELPADPRALSPAAVKPVVPPPPQATTSVSAKPSPSTVTPPQKPAPQPVKPVPPSTVATPSAIKSISPVAPPSLPVQSSLYPPVQSSGNSRHLPTWIWVAGIIAGLGLLASWGWSALGEGAPATSTATVATPPRDAQLGDTWTRPADGMVMVYVPAGEFQMGSTDGYDDEKPVHTVALDGFWIDRTEVTNAQYARCVAAGVCRPSYFAKDSDYNGAEQPVAGVSWEDAATYAAWVGGRLPTEAEWEYAARGPEGLTYPWGTEWDCARGNFDDNCGSDIYAHTAPVGSFPEGVSWVGALDMAGNAWEWVGDWYGAYPAERQVNPSGLASGDYRVLRGGAFDLFQAFARCAFRGGSLPNLGNTVDGFRVCVMPRQE